MWPCHSTDKGSIGKQGSNSSAFFDSNVEISQGQCEINDAINIKMAICGTSNDENGVARPQAVSKAEFFEEPFSIINREVGDKEAEYRTAIWKKPEAIKMEQDDPVFILPKGSNDKVDGVMKLQAANTRILPSAGSVSCLIAANKRPFLSGQAAWLTGAEQSRFGSRCFPRAMELNHASMEPQITRGLLDYAPTAGLTVIVLVFAIGPISGAHVNPAVTIATAFATLYHSIFFSFPRQASFRMTLNRARSTWSLHTLQ
ncbi:hypothetical protein GH714_019492 [Hevea brasiliensis]|uniref:Uncharacterized protein n=1 Tax=Hevea brasiliensis TaxID=3981 RepID=A0A6A6K9J2_HEVBR|nr:hypothetical protein GH714_019492 [Hevea brasiliensis]